MIAGCDVSMSMKCGIGVVGRGGRRLRVVKRKIGRLGLKDGEYARERE